MTNEQLEESLRSILSSWSWKHQKMMTLNVRTGVGDIGLKVEDLEDGENKMSIKTDERFLSLLGWLLEKRRNLTIAETGSTERHVHNCEEEAEKYLNKLLEYLDDNYVRINKKSIMATVSSWLTKDKRCS